jgi:hypothetical protein
MTAAAHDRRFLVISKQLVHIARYLRTAPFSPVHPSTMPLLLPLGPLFLCSYSNSVPTRGVIKGHGFLRYGLPFRKNRHLPRQSFVTTVTEGYVILIPLSSVLRPRDTLRTVALPNLALVLLPKVSKLTAQTREEKQRRVRSSGSMPCAAELADKAANQVRFQLITHTVSFGDRPSQVTYIR